MALDIVSAIINSIVFWIVAGAITACFCGWYAKRNGDAWGEWFVLGAIYPFFIAIPAIFFCSRPAKNSNTSLDYPIITNRIFNSIYENPLR